MKIAEANIEAISDHELGIFYGKNKESDKYYTCFGLKIGLSFIWRNRYHNSLSESYLQVFIANKDSYTSGNRESYYKKDEYIFYENEAKTKGWVRKKDKEEFKTSEQLVQFWLKDFLERDQKDRNKDIKDHSRY